MVFADSLRGVYTGEAQHYNVDLTQLQHIPDIERAELKRALVTNHWIRM